jgi:CheY-like chemotaxis protein
MPPWQSIEGQHRLWQIYTIDGTSIATRRYLTNPCCHCRYSQPDSCIAAHFRGTLLVIPSSRERRAIGLVTGNDVQQTTHSTRLTVLLANEQEGWHQTVRRLLEPQGVETVSARSGREALNLIESRPIHVAVLDQQMPQLGGMQVIKLMREMHDAPPAILLASQLSTNLLHDALSMHVFSVLSKPVDFNVLLDALARVMRRHYEGRWPKN